MGLLLIKQKLSIQKYSTLLKNSLKWSLKVNFINGFLEGAMFFELYAFTAGGFWQVYILGFIMDYKYCDDIVTIHSAASSPAVLQQVSCYIALGGRNEVMGFLTSGCHLNPLIVCRPPNKKSIFGCYVYQRLRTPLLLFNEQLISQFIGAIEHSIGNQKPYPFVHMRSRGEIVEWYMYRS